MYRNMIQIVLLVIRESQSGKNVCRVPSSAKQKLTVLVFRQDESASITIESIVIVAHTNHFTKGKFFRLQTHLTTGGSDPTHRDSFVSPMIASISLSTQEKDHCTPDFMVVDVASKCEICLRSIA